MTTANVMATNTGAGNQGRVARASSGAKAKNLATKSGTKGRRSEFDDALGKAQQKEEGTSPKDIKEVAKEVAKEDVATEKPDAANNDGKEDYAANGNKEKAADDKKPDTESKNVETDKTDAPKPQNFAAADEPYAEDAPESETFSAVYAVGAAMPLDIQATLNDASQDIAVEVPNLNSIMPQDKAAGEKNRQMLAMLSGHSFKNFGVAENDGLRAETNGNETPRAFVPRDVLSLQTAQMAENAAVAEPMIKADAQILPNATDLSAVAKSLQNTALPADAQKNSQEGSMNLAAVPVEETEAPIENMIRVPQDAARMQPEVAAAQNANTRAIDPRPAVSQSGTTKPQASAIANLLGDAEFGIEDLTSPRDNFADMMRHGFGNERQNTGQQNFSQLMTNPANNDEAKPSVTGEVAERIVERPAAESTTNTSTTPQNTATSFADTLNNVDSPSRAEEARQPQNARDPYNVRGQIVEQARLIRNTESTEMVIKLRPEHLGELTLRVSVASNGAVNASFHSSSAEVRAILENTLVQLKQELNNQGLKVENVEVYSGLADGQLPNGQGQQAWQRGQNGGANNAGGANANAAAESFEETAAETTANGAGDALATDSVDYRV